MNPWHDMIYCIKAFPRPVEVRQLHDLQLNEDNGKAYKCNLFYQKFSDGRKKIKSGHV